MTNQLIPVFNGTISNETALLCNARDLHAFLAVRRDFSTWVTERITEYGFTINLDYIIFSPISGKTIGRKKKDYHLTLDTAKELAMVERNEQGRQVRRYFIECEKRLHQQNASPVPNRECLPKMVYHTKSKYNPYRAYVWDKDKNIYVGCFPTVEEAVAAQKNYFDNGEVKRINPPRAQEEAYITNLHCLMHNFRRIDEIWRSHLRPVLEHIESPLLAKLYDRFNDSMCVLPGLEERFGKFIPPSQRLN